MAILIKFTAFYKADPALLEALYEAARFAAHRQT
jgi:hypothetical protein